MKMKEWKGENQNTSPSMSSQATMGSKIYLGNG